MTRTNEFTRYFNDLMSAFPVDTKAVEKAFRTQAELTEKFMKVAIEAAEKSAELSTEWTRDTLKRLAEVVEVKEDPADYSKALTDYATASAELGAEKMAAFAEIAKKVQMETVQLMLAAGKNAQEEATAAVKKATDDAAKAVKKASTAARPN